MSARATDAGGPGVHSGGRPGGSPGGIPVASTEDRARAFGLFRALSAASRCALTAPLAIGLGGLALCLLATGDSLLAGLFADWSGLLHDSTRDPLGFWFHLALGSLCVQLVLEPLWAIVFSGMTRGVEEVLREGKTRTFDVFRPRDSWLAILITSLTTSVLFSVVTLYLAFVSIVATSFRTILDTEDWFAVVIGVIFGAVTLPFLLYLWLGFLLAPYVCAVEGFGPMKSIARSWRMARGMRLRLFAFRIVTFVLSVSGVLACCVGALATWAWCETAWIVAYLEATRPIEERRTWRLNVWAK